MDKNILLTIQYDGTNFHGWQKQPDARTVQGEIEAVLSFLAGTTIDIHGTSRTDSGVHALGQCASFVWDNPMPTDKLPAVLNKRFGAGGLGRSGAPGDIRILSAVEMPVDFHARYSCKGKTYRYVIDGSGDIFERNHVMQYPHELDVKRMREAAEYIAGTHDFKCFETAGGTPRETTVRTVTDLEIMSDGTQTTVLITGDGFLYNMVRIIVGTLIEVGICKREPESVRDAIESRDRSKAGFTAPASGLYLERIYFEEIGVR